MRTKNLLIKTALVLIVVICHLLASERQLHYLNIGVLLVAFLISIWMQKRFFPLFTIAIGLFLMASVQQLYDEDYCTEPITLALFAGGKMMLAFAFIYEFYKTITDEAL